MMPPEDQVFASNVTAKMQELGEHEKIDFKRTVLNLLNHSFMDEIDAVK